MVRLTSIMTPKFWLALVLAMSVAACSQKSETVSSSESSSAAEEAAAAGGGDSGEAESTGVGEEEAVSGFDGEEPLTAANWAHHSSQYTGDAANTFVIYFDFDQSTIPPEAFATLRAHAQHIADTARIELTLEGHTDLRGTPEYNIALGERRAKEILRFLRVNGAHASKMDIVSFGEEKPVAFGEDEMSFAKNRRVKLNYKVGRP